MVDKTIEISTVNTDVPTEKCGMKCVICDSSAIGTNFGVLTCAPCKAFFRRNARRNEILEASCKFRTLEYSNYESDIVQFRARRIIHIRRCSSCRLQRCFEMGMKKSLIRTDEENLRHKQLVETNRERRKLLKQQKEQEKVVIEKPIVNKDVRLRDSDWRHLSNVVSAYETYCIKVYLQDRPSQLTNILTSNSEELTPIANSVTLPKRLTLSVSTFLRVLPAVHSLSRVNRVYLFKNNLLSLMPPNAFELNNSCYSEPWQVSLDNATSQFMFGDRIFNDYISVNKLAEKLLIADPAIIRLWMVMLFFSSSINCLYDDLIAPKLPKQNSSVIEIQNAYATLLWNYLSYRYGSNHAIHIFSNLIHVFLKMQLVGYEMGVQARTRTQLRKTYVTLDQLSDLDINDRLD